MTLKWGEANFTWSTITKSQEEGKGAWDEHIKSLEKCSKYESNQTLNNPSACENNEEAFQRYQQLNQSIKKEVSPLYLQDVDFGSCCQGLSNVCLCSIFSLQWKIVVRWFPALAALHDSIIKDSSRGHLSNLWKKRIHTHTHTQHHHGWKGKSKTEIGGPGER